MPNADAIGPSLPTRFYRRRLRVKSNCAANPCGLVIRPFRPRIRIEFAALHSERRVLSGVALEFIEQFQRDLAQIVSRQTPVEWRAARA